MNNILYFSSYTGIWTVGYERKNKPTPSSTWTTTGTLEWRQLDCDDVTDAPEEYDLCSIVHGMAGTTHKGHAAILTCSRQPDIGSHILFITVPSFNITT